jgi:hypothetical protein
MELQRMTSLPGSAFHGNLTPSLDLYGSAMTGLRLLYGLDRLPTTLAADDLRLPAVDLTATPLRLNSVPLPVDAWGAIGGDRTADHAARMMALLSWLLAGCGDYNEPLRRGITRYLDAVEAHVTQHRDELAAGLARFHGLYRAEDWCWSALRPLPRAWWRRNGTWVRAELAFWDGNEVISMRSRDFDTDDLPIRFRHFWNGENLPVSPFRRPFPSALDAASLRPSSP